MVPLSCKLLTDSLQMRFLVHVIFCFLIILSIGCRRTDSKILQGDVDIEILYRAIMIGDEFQVHEHVLHAAAEYVHSDKLDDGAFRIHYFFPVVWRDEAPVHMQGVTLFVRDGNIVNKFPILVQ